MTDLIDSVLGYFSDEDDSNRQAKPAKRVKQYRKKRSVVSAKKPQVTQPVKSIARLSPKSRAYLMRRLGASPKARNTVARTKKNLRSLQKSLPHAQEHGVGGDMDGFPEKALSAGYHFNNDAVDREVLEPNEEMASGMRRDQNTIDTGYMTEHEESDEGPKMKALTKQFSSVSTYSKFIRNGKKTEFGSYIVNNSDKPYIESGKMKNGKIVIKRQQRPY